jgi:hypothetical protein
MAATTATIQQMQAGEFCTPLPADDYASRLNQALKDHINVQA